MNANGKSDGFIVPMNPANKGDAEIVCGVGRGKGASKEEHRYV